MRRSLPSLLLLFATTLHAGDEGVIAPLDDLVVTGSRVAREVATRPFSVSVIDAATLAEAGPGVNLSEALTRVPGLLANNRSNYAQDLQLSLRGYGARAGFGVRGLRLYSDGIPATTPEGQGQVSHFDLAGAERLEILRGPFSALYGNSSGGVLALSSRDPTGTRLQAATGLGDDGMRQWRLGGETRWSEAWSGSASLSQFRIDGFRPHSAAERELGALRLGYERAQDRVLLTAGWFDQPADDPLGLDRAQFDADPYQTAPQATAFDTRKLARQAQAGLSWQHRYAHPLLREFTLATWGGRRSVMQWQAIPEGPQGNPDHPGGVIAFERNTRGADARLQLVLGPVDLVAGLMAEVQDEDRRGYENFIGAQRGVTGALRRDEDNRVRSFDQYLQGEWAFASDWRATLGLRNGRVRYASDDHYLDNGDDSDRRDLRYTSPVAGLWWRPAARASTWLSLGRGDETPTLNELAYRADGSAGFNTALKAQSSEQLEWGARWRGETLRLEGALFRADTEDELVVQTNQGGRSTFGNAGRSRRQGLELSADWQPLPQWRARAAYTWLDATYRDAFRICAATPCAAPTVLVPAGNRLPGTAEHAGYAELAWLPRELTALALEWRGLSQLTADDRNTEAAGGYGVFALRAEQGWTRGAQTLRLRARLDNLLDRAYAGSVIVNEGNRRYFETAPPRSLWLGLALDWGG